MTTTYDFADPTYFDPTAVRAERDRVFDLCHGCRLCWNLCPSFGSLFDLIDTAHDGAVTALGDAEHDRIVDECYQCKLCYLKCPYVPPHEWALDFPRLMLRSLAVRQREGRGPGRAARVLASTDRLGKLASATAPVVNALNRRRAFRAVVERVVGVARGRALPRYAGQRFSRWFRKRPPPEGPATGEPGVAVFPTCLVEYQEPGVGRDFVRVCDRNGVGVAGVEGAVCCGMPWLDAGDVERFLDQARRNVEALAPHAAAGRQIVVLQPTCGYVLRREYPNALGTDDARAVGGAVRDPSEFLMALHREARLDTTFDGQTPERVAWHEPCHLKAQQIGPKARDLMALTGAEVVPVPGCSGIDGTWGYRAENQELAEKVAAPLIRRVEEAAAPCAAGDCHLANGVIQEKTGLVPVHPIQVIARAYGIPEDD